MVNSPNQPPLRGPLSRDGSSGRASRRRLPRHAPCHLWQTPRQHARTALQASTLHNWATAQRSPRPFLKARCWPLLMHGPWIPGCSDTWSGTRRPRGIERLQSGHAKCVENVRLCHEVCIHTLRWISSPRATRRKLTKPRCSHSRQRTMSRSAVRAVRMSRCALVFCLLGSYAPTGHAFSSPWASSTVSLMTENELGDFNDEHWDGYACAF